MAYSWKGKASYKFSSQLWSDININARDVFVTTVTMNTSPSWDMTPWYLIDHCQVAASIPRIEKGGKMEAVGSCQTLVTIYLSTGSHYLEKNNFFNIISWYWITNFKNFFLIIFLLLLSQVRATISKRLLWEVGFMLCPYGYGSKDLE
jgi:hypothetical protein